MSKKFKDDFNLLKNKLITGENFGFARFSDGEMYVLQNKIVELNEDHFIIGDRIGSTRYNKEERKKFDPDKHQFYRNKLIDSLKFKKDNYFKGISCKCCVGQENFDFQIDIAGYDENDLTWANLWNNGNYEYFISEILPIFKNKKIIIIINEAANLEKLPFDIEKDFRVHENCFINDYNLIEEVKKFIIENKTENTIFLISAASLSNLLVHQLFEFNDKNTYIDIGSTINPIVEMEGWKDSRDYLKEYWLNSPRYYLNKECIW